MILGAHVLLYSKDPESDRAFFRDVLGFPYVDAGHGWLIFALSPAEAAIHPMEGEPHPPDGGHKPLAGDLYLMCDDLDAMVTSLKAKGIRCSEIDRAPWGVKTSIPLPGGAALGLYQPRHATALHLASR